MQQPYTARWWAREIGTALIELVVLIAVCTIGPAGIAVLGIWAGLL
jgi:hypothetical protein